MLIFNAPVNELMGSITLKYILYFFKQYLITSKRKQNNYFIVLWCSILVSKDTQRQIQYILDHALYFSIEKTNLYIIDLLKAYVREDSCHFLNWKKTVSSIYPISLYLCVDEAYLFTQLFNIEHQETRRKFSLNLCGWL